MLCANVALSPAGPYTASWSCTFTPTGPGQTLVLRAVFVLAGQYRAGAVTQVDQSREFTIRRQVLSPMEIIRSATIIGAQILRQEGKLGTVQSGAFADLLLVDGDPLADISVLEHPERSLAVIMKAGKFHRNRLH